ncbi:unnamed protein product [Dicrocoelium dendriticum]|nr:unnamed protein product [Dicrocoelium dendriticum]
MFSSDLGEFFNAASCKGTQFFRSVNTSVAHNIDILRMTTSPAVVSPLVTVEQDRLPHLIELGLSSSPDAASTDSSGQEHMYHRWDYHYTRTDGHFAPTSSPTPTGLTTVWSRPRALVHPPTDSLSLSTSAEHAPAYSSTVSQHSWTNAAASRGILRCPFCNKSFSNSSAIGKHKLTHSEERKYVCSICHKAFKRQDHLNGHKYTHEDKKPHGCCFCDKSYSDARSLRLHYENAHPLEYERWLALSQATHCDTTAIAAAAAALLSSTTTTTTITGLDLDAAVAGNSGPMTFTNPSAAASLLNALSNPMCKVFASLGRPDGSPASSATNEGQRSNGHSKSRHPHDKRHRQKRRTPHGMEWSSAGSSHSSNSCGGSASNASSPSGTIMDIGDHDEKLEDRLDKSNPLAALSSISAEDISTAAKVALLMAHPLEAPKRVACATCQKRFKNQSALNGHMRLNAGYGPAGLTAPASSTTCVNTKTGAPKSYSAVEESHCGAEETIHDTHLTVSLSQPPSGSTKSQNPGENGSVLSDNLPTEFSGFNPIAHGVSNLTSRNSLRVSEVHAHIRADDTTPAPAQPLAIATRADDSWLASRYSSLSQSVQQRASNRIPPEFSHSNLFADPRPSRPQQTPPPCYLPTQPGRSSTISASTWFTGNHLLGRDKSVPRSSSGADLRSGPSTTSASSTYPNQHGLVNAKMALRDCPDSHIAHLCDATHLEPAGVATMCRTEGFRYFRAHPSGGQRSNYRRYLVQRAITKIL